MYFGNDTIKFDVSTNGGLSFGSDRSVTTVHNAFPNINGSIGTPAGPAMDVDITGGPYDGRIYIAYLTRISSSDYDVYIRHSDDEGQSWSSAVRINDDPHGNGRDQFHPWITVDNTGIVSAVWLDRRHDPSNYRWHCYVSQSMDGGVTWSPNQQVSTAESSPGYAREAPDGSYSEMGEDEERSESHPDQEENRAGLIGEYISIACWDGYMTPIWTDTRNQNQDAYGGALEPTAVEESGQIVAAALVVGPNPADGPVSLDYVVGADGWVSLEVYDIGGRLIRTLVGRNLRGGSHRFVWDGTDQSGNHVAPGGYFVRLRAAGTEESRTIVIR